MKYSHYYRSLFGLLLAVVLLTIIIQRAGVAEIFKQIKKVSPLVLLCAVFTYLIAWVFRSLRLKLFCEQAGTTLPLLAVFKFHVSAFFLNAIFPAKLGDLALTGYLRAVGIQLARAAALVVHVRVLDGFILLLLTVSMSFTHFGSVMRSRLLLSLVATFSTLMLLLLLLFFVSGRRLTTWFERRMKLSKRSISRLIWKQAGLFLTAYEELIKEIRILPPTLFISLMVWLSEMATSFVVAVSMRLNCDVYVLLLSISLANLAKSIPITPGGLGIYEAVLISVLTLFGIPFDLAVVFSLMEHAMKKGINILIGLVATLKLGPQFREIIRISKERLLHAKP